MEFFNALPHLSFLQHALLAGVLAGIACGVVGSFVVVRRITSIAGAIAHCVLGGLGAARWLEVVHGQSWATPMLGAVTAALIAAAVIGLVTLRAKEREDTIIAALWAVGMAIGILFISRTPGYDQDLMSYLFGNILLVRGADLWLMLALDVVVVAVTVALFPQLEAICFDEEFARVRGLRVELYYLLLLALTAITVVLLVSVVGIVLVIALLTLPVAIAGRFTSTLSAMMAVSSVLTIVLTGLAYLVVLIAGVVRRGSPTKG
jgi:zinc transport system permease protein